MSNKIPCISFLLIFDTQTILIREFKILINQVPNVKQNRHETCVELKAVYAEGSVTPPTYQEWWQST